MYWRWIQAEEVRWQAGYKALLEQEVCIGKISPGHQRDKWVGTEAGVLELMASWWIRMKEPKGWERVLE